MNSRKQQQIKTTIFRRIEEGTAHSIFFIGDFTEVGSAETVRKALKEASDMGMIEHIAHGIYAKPTINQQINLPKLMINKSNFIPIGGNAKYINFPGWKVNQPYKGDYIVIYKHFF